MLSNAYLLANFRFDTPKNEPAKNLQQKLLILRQVMGDSCESADKLMRGQGVRALPSFHLWKNNEKVESIQGAKTQVLEDAIKANQ